MPILTRRPDGPTYMIRAPVAHALKEVSKSEGTPGHSAAACGPWFHRLRRSGAPGIEPAPLNAIAPPRVRVNRSCGAPAWPVEPGTATASDQGAAAWADAIGSMAAAAAAEATNLGRNMGCTSRTPR